MIPPRRIRSNHIAVAILILILALVIELLVWQLDTILRADVENQLVEEASDDRAFLEAQISEGIYITIGLESFIASRGGELPLNDMQLWMANLFDNTRHLRNIGIAPNNRISAVFPIDGNESVIGLDYRSLPAQWPAVERMMLTGQASLVGPVTLVQGGAGLIYRRPVFIDGDYWGLISTVMLMDSIWTSLETATLDTSSHVRIELLEPSGTRTPVAGSLAPAPRVSASLIMNMPGDTAWELTVSEQRAGWPLWAGRFILWAVGLLMVLYGRQRYQIRKAEHRATREKVDFIHTVSHELRTPLTSISGALSLLAREPATSATGSRLLELATRNAKRLERLVSEVLDVAKLDGAKMTLSLAPLKIGPLVKQAIENNQAFARDQGIALNLYIEPELEGVIINTDEQRFLQIFDNLLSNAVKFSDAGQQVELTVSQQKGQVSFSVQDQGIGIPAEFQTRLFERFSKVDHSDKRRNQTGTGLGLNIARDLARQMGGDIKVHSEVGRGSEFIVEFPTIEPH